MAGRFRTVFSGVFVCLPFLRAGFIPPASASNKNNDNNKPACQLSPPGTFSALKRFEREFRQMCPRKDKLIQAPRETRRVRKTNSVQSGTADGH